MAILISFVAGLLLGLLIMGLALEGNIEKYVLGLSSPLVIALSAGTAGFISYRALLENRMQAQKNRTLDAVEKLESLVDEIRIVDVNFHNWQEMNKIDKTKHNFGEMVEEMPNDLLHKYYHFALSCDKIALGTMDETYHKSLVMQLVHGTFWHHWNSLKLYISYVRSNSGPLGVYFCTGLEEYLRSYAGLSDSKYKVPNYKNDKFV